MNNVQKKKLRSRLMIAIISMLSCIAIMGVGVYAATQNFSVSITSDVSLSFAKVDGKIWAKRVGDVIYGTVSSDNGESATTVGLDNADASGYLLIHDHQRDDAEYVSEVSENLNEIQAQVNFLTRDNDTNDDGKEDITPGNRRIAYVFKYEFNLASVANINITLTDSSTKLVNEDPRNSKVTRTYKYLYSATDPTDSAWNNAAEWSHTSGETALNGNATEVYTTTFVGNNVDPTKQETYTLFVLAELTVAETNTLEDAYQLGVYDDYLWSFHLKYTPSV